VLPSPLEVFSTVYINMLHVSITLEGSCLSPSSVLAEYALSFELMGTPMNIYFLKYKYPTTPLLVYLTY
jgi:hypothetical protein